VALNFVTLVCNYVDGTGAAVSRGTVTFTPVATLLAAADDLVITQSPVIVDLSKNPQPSVSLVATDNADLNPGSWAWLVAPKFPGAPPAQQLLLNFAAGATQQLSDLQPPTSLPAIAAGGTLNGTLVLDGSPPLIIPVGATNGDVLTSDASGHATWQPAGSAVGGVTVTGTAADGNVIVATSSSAGKWLPPWGARPEAFGTITGTSGDQAAINSAISAISGGFAMGPLVITQKCAVDSTVTILPGVNVVMTGQGNRQVFPDTFTGGYICPSSSFPTGSATPLVAIGTASAPTTNPNGTTLEGLCLSGLVGGSGSTYAANCIGLLVTDTADVHVTNAFLGDFDRPGSTGTAIKLSSSSSGNGVGFGLHHSVISASYQGLYADGAGVTDLRMSNNLWHSCTKQVTLGPTAGGGGFQVVNDHFTYTGMPSGGFHLQTGSQAGDFTITGNYFDQAGNTVCVQLGNDKGSFQDNHFLATSTSTAASLVSVTVSAPAELIFCGNHCNANGSSITALLKTTAHSGIPSGGLWLNNTVYGTAASLIAPLIDSANAAIPQIPQPSGGTTNFLRADGTWANPAVGGGTVSGQLLRTPVEYAPGSQTSLTCSTSTLSAFSSANVNTGAFTAPSSGSVLVTATFVISMTTASTNVSFALAAHGTVTPVLGHVYTTEISSTAQHLVLSLRFVVSGLTSGNSYNFDLLGAGASNAITILALGSTSTTPTGTLGGPVVMSVQAI